VPVPGSDRCSACGARLAATAAWCSRCLTPAAAPAVGAVVGAPAQPARLAATVAPILPGAVPAVARPAAPPAAPTEPQAGRRTGRHRKPADAGVWPCVQCGAGVDWTADACPSCGSAFLQGVEAPLDAGRLGPWVAAATAGSRRTRVVALAGLALAVTLAGLALLTAVGVLLG
jgi:ribosomal protein L40E